MFTQCYPDSCNPNCIWIKAYQLQVLYTLFTPILDQVYSPDGVHTTHTSCTVCLQGGFCICCNPDWIWVNPPCDVGSESRLNLGQPTLRCGFRIQIGIQIGIQITTVYRIPTLIWIQSGLGCPVNSAICAGSERNMVFEVKEYTRHIGQHIAVIISIDMIYLLFDMIIM